MPQNRRNGLCFRLTVYFFLFYKLFYKFTGYQNCITTILTEHLLSMKTHGLGKQIQWLYGKSCAKLDDAETNSSLDSFILIFLMWLHRNMWYIMKTRHFFLF